MRLREESFRLLQSLLCASHCDSGVLPPWCILLDVAHSATLHADHFPQTRGSTEKHHLQLAGVQSGADAATTSNSSSSTTIAALSKARSQGDLRDSRGVSV